MPRTKVYIPTVERKYFNTKYFPYSMGYRHNIVKKLEQKIKFNKEGD